MGGILNAAGGAVSEAMFLGEQSGVAAVFRKSKMCGGLAFFQRSVLVCCLGKIQSNDGVSG